jgi:hypothetical protein
LASYLPSQINSVRTGMSRPPVSGQMFREVLIMKERLSRCKRNRAIN